MAEKRKVLYVSIGSVVPCRVGAQRHENWVSNKLIRDNCHCHMITKLGSSSLLSPQIQSRGCLSFRHRCLSPLVNSPISVLDLFERCIVRAWYHCSRSCGDNLILIDSFDTEKFALDDSSDAVLDLPGNVITEKKLRYSIIEISPWTEVRAEVLWTSVSKSERQKEPFNDGTRIVGCRCLGLRAVYSHTEPRSWRFHWSSGF